MIIENKEIKCKCGLEKLNFSSNFSADECGYEDVEGVVNHYTCSHCNTLVEVVICDERGVVDVNYYELDDEE